MLFKYRYVHFAQKFDLNFYYTKTRFRQNLILLVSGARNFFSRGGTKKIKIKENLPNNPFKNTIYTNKKSLYLELTSVTFSLIHYTLEFLFQSISAYGLLLFFNFASLLDVWASAPLNYANAFNAAVLHHRIYRGDTYGYTEAAKRTNLRAPMLMRRWATNMQKHTHFNC